MKNMAQGAAEAVKNTLGMNNASNAPDTNHPSNPFSRGWIFPYPANLHLGHWI